MAIPTNREIIEEACRRISADMEEGKGLAAWQHEVLEWLCPVSHNPNEKAMLLGIDVGTPGNRNLWRVSWGNGSGANQLAPTKPKAAPGNIFAATPVGPPLHPQKYRTPSGGTVHYAPMTFSTVSVAPAPPAKPMPVNWSSLYLQSWRSPAMTAPDPDVQLQDAPHDTIFGEIEGWRAWRLHIDEAGEPWLGSVGVGSVWPAGHVDGKTVMGDPDGEVQGWAWSPSPSQQGLISSTQACEDCCAGFWAVPPKELGALLDFYPRSTPVIGKVRMWGAVAEHARGWRAECMEIVSLHTRDEVFLGDALRPEPIDGRHETHSIMARLIRKYIPTKGT